MTKTQESMPRVSIIMPMYNGLPYVGEAIESIISQTFQNWELLVINDASTDGSPDVVRQYSAKDSRIRLIDNNTGLKGEGPARNCGLDNATGEYIAMLDADDISIPRRLEKQVKFMDNHPDIVLSGCFVQLFGAHKRVFRSPPYDWMIKALLCFKEEPWGPTIIFRRTVIKERYVQIPIGTDTLFTTQICLKHKVANVPEKLYLYRVHSKSITRSVDNYPYRKEVLGKLLPMRLGFTPTDHQINAHLALRLGFRGLDGGSVKDQFMWMAYVLKHGRYKWYERGVLLLWFVRMAPIIICPL